MTSKRISIRVMPSAVSKAEVETCISIPLSGEAGLRLEEVALEIHASKITSSSVELTYGGGANERKFVRGTIEPRLSTMQTLCNGLQAKVDARDVAYAVASYAAYSLVPRSQLHELLHTSRTKIKELFGITRICTAVSDAIDQQDQWLTHENYVYISRRQTEADQLDALNEILDPERRSAKARRKGPKSRVERLQTLCQLLEPAQLSAEALGPLPERSFLTCEELELCEQSCKALLAIASVVAPPVSREEQAGPTVLALPCLGSPSQ